MSHFHTEWVGEKKEPKSKKKIGGGPGARPAGDALQS